MKKKLRTFSWFLAICMTIFTQPCRAIAPKQSDKDISARCIEHILAQNHSENETIWYVVRDRNGNDISSNFTAIVNGAQVKSESLSVASFVDSYDIVYFAKITEYTFLTTNSDIGKTHVEQVIRELTATGAGGREVTLDVEYSLTGTIYYNPNTYRISSTVGPRRSSIRFIIQSSDSDLDFGTTNVSSNVSVSTNKLSATFTHSNKIIATPPYGASPFDFGYINTTFIIYAES